MFLILVLSVALLAMAGCESSDDDDDANTTTGGASAGGSATGGAAGGGTGASTTGGSVADYPAGPFGTSEGSTIENIELVDAAGESFSLAEFRQGKQILLIATAAGWCTACFEDQDNLQAFEDEFGPRGLGVMLAYFQDAETNAATVEDAAGWRDRFNLSFPVAVDSEFKFSAYYDERQTPMVMFVNAETMEILQIRTGWDQSLYESLLQSAFP